ncbi:MAG: hypothetical protein O7H41_20260 [Planctomycetota bacterium]|nr:hypothetical protein [Planctomycetota bacterium]
MRTFQVVSAVLLLGLCFLKVKAWVEPAPVPASVTPTAYKVTSFLAADPVQESESGQPLLWNLALGLAASLEFTLGVFLLLNYRPRLSALGLAALGTAFGLVVLLSGPSASGCGCLGSQDSEYGTRMLIASTMVLLGGIQVLSPLRQELSS